MASLMRLGLPYGQGMSSSEMLLDTSLKFVLIKSPSCHRNKAKAFCENSTRSLIWNKSVPFADSHQAMKGMSWMPFSPNTLQKKRDAIFAQRISLCVVNLNLTCIPRVSKLQRDWETVESITEQCIASQSQRPSTFVQQTYRNMETNSMARANTLHRQRREGQERVRSQLDLGKSCSRRRHRDIKKRGQTTSTPACGLANAALWPGFSEICVHSDNLASRVAQKKKSASWLSNSR